MTINSLAPGFVLLYYLGPQNVQHRMVFGVKVSDPNAAIPLILQRDSAVVSVNAGVAAYVAVLKALVPNTVTFQYFEFWSQPTPSDDPVFKYTLALATIGTNAAGSVANSQLLASWRSTNGGTGKTVILEQSYAVNLVFKPAGYSDAAKLALVNYLTGTSNIVYARDNGWPAVVPKMFTKTNDALRKKTVLNAP